MTRGRRFDLHYKLHGSARPISMTSDIIRKCSHAPLSQRPRVPPIPLACHPSHPLKHRPLQPPQIPLDAPHLPSMAGELEGQARYLAHLIDRFSKGSDCEIYHIP